MFFSKKSGTNLTVQTSSAQGCASHLGSGSEPGGTRGGSVSLRPSPHQNTDSLTFAPGRGITVLQANESDPGSAREVLEALITMLVSGGQWLGAQVRSRSCAASGGAEGAACRAGDTASLRRQPARSSTSSAQGRSGQQVSPM